MLGGEGDGLNPVLQKKADFNIGIGGQRRGEGGVDSLNVSVASGLLCEAFLRMPAGTQGFKTNHARRSSTGPNRLF